MKLTIALINPNNMAIPSGFTESLESNDIGNNDSVFVEYKGDGKKSYVELFNKAYTSVKSGYIMFMNIDDTITPKYITDLKAHISAYPDVSAFLPIVHEVDDENMTIGLKNESAWVHGQMTTSGIMDFEALKSKPTMSLAGLTLKVDKNKQFFLKKNIKVHYNYEWVLRYLNSGNKLMVVPKIGVKHCVTKSDYYLSAKDMGKDELKFWYNISKKEYYFEEDREITYK
jgi:hypothetical protein